MNILVFGLGNAGSVLIKNLYNLFLKYLKTELNFIFITRNSQKVASYLNSYTDIFKNSFFLEVKDFNSLKNNIEGFKSDFKDIGICINASLPKFNNLIQNIAIELNSHYMDMSSDMYDDNTLSNMYFSQFLNNESFKLINKFALVNLGVSPGLTNFLIARTARDLLKNKNCNIESIDIFLFENFIADKLVLSWSPQVAIEEFTQEPKHLVNGEIVTYKPFAHSITYRFPNTNYVLVYPIFQEEIIGLSNALPSVKTIQMYAGGSEIDFFKNLYQFGLLNYDNLEKLGLKNEHIELLIKNVYSSINIDSFISDISIIAAQFTAVAELNLKYSDGINSKYTISVNFDNYRDILQSEFYKDSTYIGYITGISASLLLFFTYFNYLEDQSKFVGVLDPEYLSDVFDTNTYNLILKELTNNLIEYHLHVSTK